RICERPGPRGFEGRQLPPPSLRGPLPALTRPRPGAADGRGRVLPPHADAPGDGPRGAAREEAVRVTAAGQPMSSKKRLRRRLWLTLLAYLCLMLAVFLYYSESAHRVLFGQLTAVEFVVTDATTGAPVYAQVNLEIDGGRSPMSTSVSPDEA